MSSGEADVVVIPRPVVPVPVDDIIARLEAMTDDPAILDRELRRLGIDCPIDAADREDD